MARDENALGATGNSKVGKLVHTEMVNHPRKGAHSAKASDEGNNRIAAKEEGSIPPARAEYEVE